MKILNLFYKGLFIPTVLFGLISCGQVLKPEKKIQKVTLKKTNPRYRLEKQYHPVMNIAMYFEKKDYVADSVIYTEKDLLVPSKIKSDIEALSDEEITFPLLLKSEIEAHHYKRFSNLVIQRIFNFTFWYDQKRSKKEKYSLDKLNETERKNIRFIEFFLYK